MVGEELVEEGPRSARSPSAAGAVVLGNQVRDLVAEAEEARGLEARRSAYPAAAMPPERPDGLAGQPAGPVEHAPRDRRPAAAGFRRQGDPVAERPEDPAGGDPDPRLEVVGEGVRKQRHLAARRGRLGGGLHPPEPTRERLASETREAPAPIKTDGPGEQGGGPAPAGQSSGRAARTGFPSGPARPARRRCGRRADGGGPGSNGAGNRT